MSQENRNCDKNQLTLQRWIVSEFGVNFMSEETRNYETIEIIKMKLETDINIYIYIYIYIY